MKKYLVPLIALMVILGICMVSRGQEQMKISEIKSSDLTVEKREVLIGKTVTVEGYYIDDPIPMLVESMDLYFVNTPIPEDKYIVLAGKGIENLPSKKFFGAYVKVVGTIAVSKEPYVEENVKKFGVAYALELVCASPPVIIVQKDTSKMSILPAIADIKIRITPDIIRPAPRGARYAILLSGGIGRAGAYMRYWNDLKFMYAALIKNGFSPKEIIVIYKDGIGEDQDMPVNYAARLGEVEKAFKYVKDHIAPDGLFFYFSTNHGGGLEIPGYYYAGYSVDTNNDEPEAGYDENALNRDLNHDGDMADTVKVDEITFLYNDPDDLVDDKLASLFSPIVCKGMIIVMEQCYSGGNIYDLRCKTHRIPFDRGIFGTGKKAPKRIIISACSETEPSWASASVPYDEFSYYFTSALNGATPNGTAVDADLNHDGKTSILEVYTYARDHDARPETPFYEDNGDGFGHTIPSPQNGDGSLGESIFLE